MRHHLHTLSASLANTPGGDTRARRGDWKMLGFLYTQIKLFELQKSLPSDYLTMLSTYKYSHVSLKELVQLFCLFFNIYKH